jgi:hypothetical protein
VKTKGMKFTIDEKFMMACIENRNSIDEKKNVHHYQYAVAKCI